MAELILSLLSDLGVFGATPTTFIDLFQWAVTVTVTVAYAFGLIGMFFWTCSSIGKGGKF